MWIKMIASLFPHLGTDFTTKILLSGFIFDCMFVEPFSIVLIWSPTFAYGHDLSMALAFRKGFVQAEPSLPGPWCKEIKPCSQGNVVCFEDYKAMENIARKFWDCRGDWRFSGEVQPRDPGEVLSCVGYHFFFLEEGLQKKISEPRPTCHFLAPSWLFSFSRAECTGWKARQGCLLLWFSLEIWFISLKLSFLQLLQENFGLSWAGIS